MTRTQGRLDGIALHTPNPADRVALRGVRVLARLSGMSQRTTVGPSPSRATAIAWLGEETCLSSRPRSISTRSVRPYGTLRTCGGLSASSSSISGTERLSKTQCSTEFRPAVMR